MRDLLTVEIPRGQMQRLTAALDDAERQLPREIAIAVNKTRTSLAKEIAKEIRQEVAMKAKDIKDAIKSGSRANVKKLYTRITLKYDERWSLKRFGPRQTRKGTSYRISKKGGREMRPGAFMGPRPGAIAVKLGGHVFRRRSKRRSDIVKLHGVSPYGTFIANKMRAVTVRKGEQELIKQINARIRFRLLKRQGVI